jgi:acetyl esterase/lipase
MPRTVLVLIVLLGPAPLGRTEEKPTLLKLWPGQAPGETGKARPEKVSEQKHGQKTITLVTDVAVPTITLFRPARDKDTGASVLICPGGGYHVLAWDLEGTEVAHWLNSLGVTGVVLKYRVPRRPGQPGDQPPPGPLQDAQRALRLVRSKADQWKLDPHRIGILGFSAGGHLAAAAAMRFREKTYEPVDEIDKVSCRPDFAVLVYPAYLVTKNRKNLTPDLHVSKKCPPTFLVHAGNDGVPAENSVLTYLALKQVGVTAELHVYATGGHGFGLRPSAEPCSTWPQRCAAWLRTQGFFKHSPRN